MPVTCKRTETREDGTEAAVAFTRFVYRPHWFVLGQTEGAELEASALPTWDALRALAALDVAEVPFEMADGNCFGYATARQIAVNPVAPLPHHTRFHELAHVLLGHTAQAGERLEDRETLSRNQRELEAECVALVCSAALGLDGEAYSRGYIQHWWGAGNPVPERSAQRILKVADQILRAGQPAAEGAGEPAIAA